MDSSSETSILTVGQLTGRIRSLLEQNFESVWVQGEISNLTLHRSGHWYFSIKDQTAQLNTVMFRRQNAAVAFEPTHGMQVTLRGGISVYPPHGRYQLIVQEMLPAGVGDLHLAFEALKRKLEAEGLFDPQLKKSLPAYPGRIGIVTSPTGAAIRDMLQVMARRYPLADILLFPARVQGEGAAQEIVAGIQYFNENPCDVLIIGRGGGSLEDLWTFNEESVARAVFDSRIPVVSAVGHEIDFTIADMVADLRAPTPSAAAEDRNELLQTLTAAVNMVNTTLRKKLISGRLRHEAVLNSYGLKRTTLIIQTGSQRLDHIRERLTTAWQNRLDHLRTRIGNQDDRLRALSPEATLSRGYSVVTDPNGTVVQDAASLHKGEMVDIRLERGRFSSEVRKIHDDD